MSVFSSPFKEPFRTPFGSPFNGPGVGGGGAAVATVAQASTQQLSVSWPADASALVYVLERATDSGYSDATQVYSGSATSFEDTGLSAATTYYYRVTAADESSEWANGEGSAATATDGGAFDTDAFNYFVAAGITDAGHRTAVDDFVTQLKADGLWADLAVLSLGVWGSASANGLNIKNPAFSNAAFREQFFGAVTHGAGDVAFAGVAAATDGAATAACATNYLIPSIDLPAGAKTYFHRMTGSTTNRWSFGAEITSGNLRDRVTVNANTIGGTQTESVAISSAMATPNAVVGGTVNGDWFLLRSGALATDVLWEKDGVTLASSISAQTGAPTVPIATNGYTTNTPIFNSLGYLNQSRSCFAAWGIALDGTQRGAFRTALSTLIGALV